MNAINFFCSLMYLQKLLKKKATQHKIQSFLRECPNKFSHGTEANIFPSNPLQQLWNIKTNMQTWVWMAVEKDHNGILADKRPL